MAPPQVRHTSVSGQGAYKGIPFFATPGLHELVADVFAQYSGTSQKDGLTLDLGGGTGAFSKRLADIGYRVEAVELETQAWQVPEVPVKFVDFCAAALPADVVGRYDRIVSLEVIEHVPDAVAFIKNIAQALKPGGIAIVTTPSPLNLLGIALMSWKGELPLFSYQNYWDTGHRNILPDFLLRAFAVDAKLEVVDLTYGITGKIPLKVWLSLLPMFPVVLWQMVKFPKRWNKLHTILVVRKPQTDKQA